MHRHHVLDVKLRSDQVHTNRVRLARISFLVLFGTLFSLYLLWKTGELALNTLVYENQDFAIELIDAQTDGKIAPEQLRRWTRVKVGANLIALDLAEVKRNLELVSVIDSVSVERVLPHTLKIRVTERRPIAQVNVPRADPAGGISVSVYQLDEDGVVIQPLDPRVCTVPLAEMNPQLPVIAGLNYFQLQPGRRLELPAVQAALRLVAAFDRSPMLALGGSAARGCLRAACPGGHHRPGQRSDVQPRARGSSNCSAGSRFTITVCSSRKPSPRRTWRWRTTCRCAG